MRNRSLVSLLLLATSFGACAEPPSPAALPPVTVYKSPSCGCCSKWVAHMREAGFTVEVRDVDNVHPIKMRVGLPCHTAEVGGYFLEGHVPAADVKRLVTEKPAAKGLAVPGMPVGS